MAWTNSPLIVYPGTIEQFALDVARKVDLSKGRRRADFGRGFYTTPIQQQAERHANNVFRVYRGRAVRSSRAGPNYAAIVKFEVDRTSLGKLFHLDFVQPYGDWQDFVRHCRGVGSHMTTTPGGYYDVVRGPALAPGGRAYRGYEQLSFHSDSACQTLKVVDVFRGSPLFT